MMENSKLPDDVVHDTIDNLLDKKWKDIVKAWTAYEAKFLDGAHPVTKRHHSSG